MSRQHVQAISRSQPSSALLPALPVAAFACAVGAVPLVLPTAAAASAPTSMLATLAATLPLHHHWSDTLLWCYTGIGASCLLTSLVCTARFLLSFHPSLEQEAELQRWAMPWRAVTLFDPLLQPLRRGFFRQTAPGDLDYAAVALLATVCSLLECLVGKDGLMNDFIPDFALRDGLQFIIFFQHGLLLPCWVIVVLRWGKAL